MTKFNPDQVIYDFNGKTPMRMPAPRGHVGPVMTARRALFATLRQGLEEDAKFTPADTIRLHTIGRKLWAPTVDVKPVFLGEQDYRSQAEAEEAIEKKGETVAEAMADAVGAALADAKAKPKAEGEADDANPTWVDLDSDETTMILDRCHKIWGALIYVALCQIVDPARLKK